MYSITLKVYNYYLFHHNLSLDCLQLKYYLHANILITTLCFMYNKPTIVCSRHISLTIFYNNVKLMKISFSSDPNSDKVIVTKFCTYDDQVYLCTWPRRVTDDFKCVNHDYYQRTCIFVCYLTYLCSFFCCTGECHILGDWGSYARWVWFCLIDT